MVVGLVAVRGGPAGVAAAVGTGGWVVMADWAARAVVGVAAAGSAGWVGQAAMVGWAAAAY